MVSVRESSAGKFQKLFMSSYSKALFAAEIKKYLVLFLVDSFSLMDLHLRSSEASYYGIKASS